MVWCGVVVGPSGHSQQGLGSFFFGMYTTLHYTLHNTCMECGTPISGTAADSANPSKPTRPPPRAKGWLDGDLGSSLRLVSSSALVT